MALQFDGHTHAFNAGFLPVYGILRSKGLSHENAEPVRAIIEIALERDKPESLSFAAQHRAPHVALMDMVDAEARGEPQVQSGPDFIGRFALMIPREQLLAIAHVLRDTPRHLNGESGHAASFLRLSPWLVATDDVAYLRACADSVLRHGARLAGPIEPSDRGSGAIAPTSANGTVEWLMLLTRHESRQLTQFAEFWEPSGEFVGRTHFMMDMVKHYQGHTVYGFVDDQHQRMRAVAADAELPLIGFTAFDPFRDDCLDIVKHAIGNGFCGVKFYPPNGFRPIGNTAKDIKGGPSAKVVNERNMALFEWCVAEDVPIFTHCTPSGLESQKGKTGKFSDPAGWRAVLESPGLAGLRLCFGHAGGQEGWLADFSSAGQDVWKQSYAATVVELCEDPRFPNLFCDFGYFDEALSDDGESAFQARLEAACGPDGSKFRRACGYGTDWHLILVDDNARTWPKRMRKILSSAKLASSADDVMFGNAIRFLNLEGFLRRSTDVLSAQEKVQIAQLRALV